MTKVLSITNLLIGKNNDNQAHASQVIKFINTVCSEANKDGEISDIVVNGNTFANSRISARSLKLFYNVVNKLNENFTTIVFNQSAMDLAKQSDIKDGSIIAALVSDYRHCVVATDIIEFTDYAVVPIGKKLTDVDTEQKLIFTVFNKTFEPLKDKVIINGVVEEFSIDIVDNATYVNLGNGFQINLNNDVDKINLVKITMDEEPVVEYDKITVDQRFIKIILNENHIDGLPAIKWIADNKNKLKEAEAIYIVPDAKTSDGVISKIRAILDSINPNFAVEDTTKTNNNIKITENPETLQSFLGVLPEDCHYFAELLYNKVTEIK